MTTSRAFQERDEMLMRGDMDDATPTRSDYAKKSIMTDAEYMAAQSQVEELWQRTCSLRAAHEAASRAWCQASGEIRTETRAREIDQIVADAIGEVDQ